MRRTITLAILATVSAITAAAVASPALARPAIARAAIQDTYCLQGRSSGYPGNCQFSSYEQCQASASGTGDGCGTVATDLTLPDEAA
jgi:Protein of unknown function (DUF3551)